MRSARRAWLVAIAILASGGTLTACGGGPTADMPDVVGVALDDAHNELKAAGFEEFEDEDEFEERAILMDSNWVVLKQEPPAGEVAEQESTIKLKVGKIGEQRTTDQLPDGSPVLAATEAAAEKAKADAAKRAAADATKKAEDAAAYKTLLAGYVNSLDPLVRLGNRMFAEMDRTAAGVRNDEYGFTQSAVLGSALDAADVLISRLNEEKPPKGSKRAGTHEAMVKAAERLREGAATLLSAVDEQKASSLARWEEVRQDAHSQWNASLQAMYKDSGAQPPLLP